MPSMFKTMAKSLVKEVGKKDLNPVSNLSSSHRFRPFCLLRKKSKKHKFWSKKFTCTEFSLMDILEPNSPVPGYRFFNISSEVNQERQFHFCKKVDGKLMGAMGLDMEKKIDMNIGVSAGIEKSHGSFLEMQILTISYQTWTTLQMERKLVKPEPTFIGELRSRGEDLYVVIEAMELVNSPVLGSKITLRGAGSISFPELVNVERSLFFGDWHYVNLPAIIYLFLFSHVRLFMILFGVFLILGQGHGSRGKQKLMTIPPHSILAYRAAKLSISENSWEILYFLGKKQKTFQNRRDSEDESKTGEEFLSV